MDLVGAWLRQLLRAGTAAAIVPAAMVAALVVVLVGAGGLGGLGSLRQVLVGPEISPAETGAAGARGTDVAPIAPAPRRPATQRAAPRRTTAARTRAVAPPAPPSPPRRVVPPPRAPVVPPPPPPPPAISPEPAIPPPPPPEHVATAQRPALERTTQQLVDGVDHTLDTVGELLVTIIKRLGRLLPPPRR
ncbi:MAG: hypothetical protein QOD24_4883 [Solirubrobacteraceae bacterium]|nr:hypothetical protein [Solirubrobacteraceae bacterium]